MGFWGVEVKAGKPLTVKPGFGRRIHIFQASLGKVKKDASKGAKNVPLRLKIDGKNFIIGNLVPKDRPKLMFNLPFEKEFELSHDLKTGSVYFRGLERSNFFDVKPAFSGSSISTLSEGEASHDEHWLDEQQEILKQWLNEPLNEQQLEIMENVEDKDKRLLIQPAREMAIAESLAGASSDGLSGQDDDDLEEEEEPVKASNKRPAQPVASSPGKKAKASTPTDNKTGGNKKGPNPSKPAGKASPGGNNSNKSKQSPKSGGQFSGGNKNFNSKNGGGSNKKGPNPSKPAGKASPGGNNSNKSKQSPKSGGQFSDGNKNFNSKNGGKGKGGGK